MARRPVKNKKLPSEYPTFAFRVSVEMKDKISNLISEIQEHANSRREKDDPFMNKNDVIVKALLDGLSRIRRSQGGGKR